jgi:tetratricopeptide (TPR) repeat protein/cell division septation protein DedD
MGRFGVTLGATSTLRPLRRAGGVLCLIGVLCLLWSGCGRGTFVGRQYDDFTAYYNKFYNANRAFEKGVEAVEDTDRPIDRTRYLPVFPAPETPGSGGEFEAAIQKSADVLRESPQSRWVDDALLLIGMSYFYQGNYVGAAQKFREVLALPEGRRKEARFWLARTLVTNDRLEAALEAVQVEGPDRSSDDPWVARQLLVLGQLRVHREQWAEAAAALERGLAGDVPDVPGARGAFLLGQVYETLDRPEAARAAYRRVRDFDPRYELGFAARLSAIELQGQHGNAADALDRLDDLQGDDKNYERRGAMALVEARIYRAQGREERARRVLRDLLYTEADGALPQSDVARLHYELAVLYRDAFENFSRAAAHFDTSGTRSGGAAQGQQRERRQLPSAPVDAQAQAERYRTLAERSEDVARLDSLLRIGRMSAAEYEAFVADLRRERKEQVQAQQDRRTGRRLRARETSPSEQRQRRPAAAQSQEADAGFLFYKDPTRVQQGRQRFVERWGDRPRVANWRRRNAMQNIQAGGEEPEAEASEPAASPTGETTASGTETTALDLSNIPRDAESQAEMEAQRAVARYELGNALFLGANRPDSAATWYRRVLQEDGDQPVARRALYALAEAHRAQGDTLSARQAYRRLIEQHPKSVLADRARRRLGEDRGATRKVRADRADSLYARAYARWQDGAWRPALDDLLWVASQYPRTAAAPRALLASAIIYWRQATTEDGAAHLRVPVIQYLRRVKAPDPAAVDSGLARLGGSATPDSASVDSVALSVAPSAGRRAPSISLPDSVQRRPDTTVGRGNPPVPRDGVDSVSTAAQPPPAVGAGPAPLAPLKALLRHLTTQYPEAPQGTRAEALQALLEDRGAGAGTAAGDGEAPSSPPIKDTSAARSDTAGTAPGRPSTRTPASRTQPDGAPRPAPTSASPSRPNRSQTDPPWTLQVQVFSSSDAAARRVSGVQKEVGGDWRVDVVRDTTGETTRHRVVLGRFESRAAAVEAQRRLSGRGLTELSIRPYPESGAAR